MTTKLSEPIEPHHLDGMVALAVAQSTPLKKQKDERDTEFVKRIVCAYLNIHSGFLAIRENA